MAPTHPSIRPSSLRYPGQALIIHGAYPIFIPAHEFIYSRPHELHFRVLFLDLLGNAHFLGAAGGISGILSKPFRRYLLSQDCKTLGNIIGGLETPDINVSASL